MTVHIVRLGTPRLDHEGLRIGTVRHPPRGVRKERFSIDNWYDVWYPELSPTADLVSFAKHGEGKAHWEKFFHEFRQQMKDHAAIHTLDVLAALSHNSDFSVGCYCELESQCHRAVLRELLTQRGAKIL